MWILMSKIKEVWDLKRITVFLKDKVLVEWRKVNV